jgi:hypothetical protein
LRPKLHVLNSITRISRLPDLPDYAMGYPPGHPKI